MIKKYEFYHGAVFTTIIHGCPEDVTIKPYPTNSNASYILNASIGLYIKHSTKRLTPWRFSFHKVHQEEICEMKKRLKSVYLILVCGEDGIVALTFDELRIILDANHGEIEWISAARSRNKEYTINGSDGGLGRKIGKSDFPRKIFDS
jgi:hypothetical protein